MFMGVQSHRNIPRVASYDMAQAAAASFESKRRKGKSVTQVNQHDDGTIAFQLYDTEVVTWCPDNSIEIDNYGTTTTSSFAHRFLPAGIHLHYPVERRTSSGGANTIGFRQHDDVKGYKFALCQGDVVKFRPIADDLWAPDEATCYDITLPTGVDRRVARKLMAPFHLGDFEMWMSMAPMHFDAAGDTIEHAEWDLAECMDALEKRDFRQAAMHLPTMKDTGAYGHTPRPLPIRTPHGDYIGMGCVAKLKLAIWDDLGLLQRETRKVWDRSEYDRRMARVREMDALGLSVVCLGAS